MVDTPKAFALWRVNKRVGNKSALARGNWGHPKIIGIVALRLRVLISKRESIIVKVDGCPPISGRHRGCHGQAPWPEFARALVRAVLNQ